MALKIRLARGGAKKRPYYNLVIADCRSPRDGRFVEKVGTYNPMVAADHAERLVLKEDRIKYWLSVGAQPTDRLAKFFGQRHLMAMPEARQNSQKAQPKKKAQERIKAETTRQEALKKEAEAQKQSMEDAKNAADVAAAEASTSNNNSIPEERAE